MFAKSFILPKVTLFACWPYRKQKEQGLSFCTLCTPRHGLLAWSVDLHPLVPLVVLHPKRRTAGLIGNKKSKVCRFATFAP